MLHDLDFNFKIICVTETWYKENGIETNSNFQIPGYRLIHQARAGIQTGGGVCMFLHNSINYKVRNDFNF